MESWDKFLYTEISIVGIIILTFIYSKNKRNIGSSRNGKIFAYLLITLGIIMVVDAVMWVVEAIPGTYIRIIYKTAAVIFYTGTGVLGLLWLLYCEDIILPYRRPKVQNFLLSIPCIINFVIAFISIWTDSYYSINDSNVYGRGDLFWVFSVLCYAYFLYATILALYAGSRKDISDRYEKYSLAAFLLFPLAGSIIQVAFYGMSITGICFTLALLLVFFNVQDKQINIDFLTQLNNRRKMIEYLYNKIRNISNGKNLYAVLLDIDEFKTINDKFGHETGDSALCHAADILKRVSKQVKGFVARMSGDEFVIIFECEHREKVLEFEKAIEDAFAEFSANNTTYKLQASMGYAEFGAGNATTVDAFLHEADAMMYFNKTIKKQYGNK